MNKLKLFHTADELKDCEVMGIVFLTRGDWYFHEANFCGTDFHTGEKRFECNGLRVDNRDIWLWCSRIDLLKRTN